MIRAEMRQAESNSEPSNCKTIAASHGPGAEQATLGRAVTDVIVECQAIRHGAPPVRAFNSIERARTLDNRFGRGNEQSQVPYVPRWAEAFNWWAPPTEWKMPAKTPSIPEDGRWHVLGKGKYERRDATIHLGKWALWT